LALPDWLSPESLERVLPRLPGARYHLQARTVKYQPAAQIPEAGTVKYQLAAQIPEAGTVKYQLAAQILCWA